MKIENVVGVVGVEVQKPPRNREMGDLDQLIREREQLNLARTIYVSPEVVFTLSSKQRNALLRSLGHETPEEAQPEKKTNKPRGRDSGLIAKLREMGDDYIHVQKVDGKYVLNPVSTLADGIGVVDKDGGKIWSNITYLSDSNECLGYVYPENTWSAVNAAVGTKKTHLSRERRRVMREKDLDILCNPDKVVGFKVGPRTIKSETNVPARQTTRVVSVRRDAEDKIVVDKVVQYVAVDDAGQSDTLLSVHGDDNILRSKKAAENRTNNSNFRLAYGSVPVEPQVLKFEGKVINFPSDTEVKLSLTDADYRRIAHENLLVQFLELANSEGYKNRSRSRYRHVLSDLLVD